MMCINKYRINRSLELVARSFSEGGKRFVFAPCGQCEDCRKKSQYAWAWRLTSDLQYYVQTKGYKCGFITLTYNDNSLPRFPSCYISLAGQPCFSKDHTEKFVLYVRKKLFEMYGATDTLYFLSSEYGKKTQRPHYHFLIAWDASKCSAEQVHEIIRHYWADDFVCKMTNKLKRPALGFVCPATPQGGESKRSGKKILPFEVVNLNDCMMSAFYTAKYVTKDVYFMRTIKGKVVNKEEWQELKQFMPHHRQKKSLGFDSVASLSDKEKITLMSKGRCFLGSDRLMKPPLYIQRKLLFSPCYIIDSSGNRLVRDQATDFYYRNYDLIMSKRMSYYDTLFNAMKDRDYWISSGLCAEDADEASLFVIDNDSFVKFGCSLAQAYLHYYGMPYNYCYTDMKLTDMMRYHYWFPEKCHAFVNFTYSCLRIDKQQWSNIQEFFDYLMSFVMWRQESVTDEDADFVRDFYNNVSAQGD